MMPGELERDGCLVAVPGRAWLWVPGRPETLNTHRKQHWTDRSTRTRTDRETGWVLGQRLRVRHAYIAPKPATVSSQPVYKTRRSWPDVAAWIPTVKAVIDGLVDADMWPDDTAEHVGRLVFDAPRLGDTDGLLIAITPTTEGALQ